MRLNLLLLHRRPTFSFRSETNRRQLVGLCGARILLEKMPGACWI